MASPGSHLTSYSSSLVPLAGTEKTYILAPKAASAGREKTRDGRFPLDEVDWLISLHPPRSQDSFDTTFSSEVKLEAELKLSSHVVGSRYDTEIRAF